MKDALLGHMVVLALGMLDASTEYKKPKLSLQKKPIATVFSLDAFPAKRLRLSPLSLKASKLTSEKTTQVTCKINGEQMVLQRLVDEEKIVSEFWLVYARSTSNRKEANMQLQMFDVPLDLFDTQTWVSIPCCVNFKAIKQNDELVLFKEDAPKTKKEAAVTSEFEPKSKKQRT